MDCIFVGNVTKSIMKNLPEGSIFGMTWIKMIEKLVVIVLNVLIMCCYIGLTLNVIEGRECITVNVVYAVVLVIVTILYTNHVRKSNKVVTKKDPM